MMNISSNWNILAPWVTMLDDNGFPEWGKNRNPFKNKINYNGFMQLGARAHVCF